jgi:hypothetical protein
MSNRLWRGTWWKFDRYCIEGGYIQPAPDADLSVYDPWQDYDKTWSRRGAREDGLSKKANASIAPSYQAFLELFRDVKRQGAETRIIQWCSQNGLLGLLHQSALEVCLPVAADASSGIDDGYKIQPTSHPAALMPEYSLHRVSQHILYPRRKDNLRTLPGQVRFNAAVPFDFQEMLDEGMLGGRPPGVHWEYLDSGEIAQFSLEEKWDPFFVANARPMRVPTAEEPSVRSYREPLSAFLEALEAFYFAYDALTELRHLQTSGKPPDSPELAQATVLGRRGLECMNRWAAGVSPVLQEEPDGTLRQYLWGPSLLSNYAYMAIQDFSDNNRIYRCARCQLPFASGAWQAKYCSRRCAKTAAQANWRKGKAGSSKQGEEGA